MGSYILDSGSQLIKTEKSVSYFNAQVRDQIRHHAPKGLSFIHLVPFWADDMHL